MTNISGNEKIRNSIINLFAEKLNNDSVKAEEYVKKYLGDNIINENEYQEISAEFGEDFANEAKAMSETTANGTKKEDVKTWEDAVKYMSEKQGINVGELKAGTEPKDCTRTTKTYYYDGGQVILKRPSDHGDYTVVTIQADDNKNYTYYLTSGTEQAEGVEEKEANTTTAATSETAKTSNINGTDYVTYFKENEFNYDQNSGKSWGEQRYDEWYNRVDEDWINAMKEKSQSKTTTVTGGSINSATTEKTGNSDKAEKTTTHAIKVDDCKSAFEKAEEVHKAIEGASDDWKGLIDILGNISNTDRNRIMMAYEIKYGTNMKEDIEDQVAGWGGWFTFTYGSKKDSVISYLTSAEANPNKEGKKEKEELRDYFNGGRW